MNKSGKVWGLTKLLLETKVCELHYIEFNEGHECSKHKHNTKFNAFYCLEGELRIDVWKNNYDLVDTTILRKGEMTVVPPGEYHKFIANTNGSALELYWAEFDSNDIARESVGS
jgi:quercetin dioxygenase-like cupin family protein